MDHSETPDISVTTALPLLAESVTPQPGLTQPPRYLVVRTEDGSRRLVAGNVYRVGRDPYGHIVLGDPRVSWAHGELRTAGDRWVFRDLGSQNGTYLAGQRVPEVEITQERVLRLGQPEDGPELTCTPLGSSVLATATAVIAPDDAAILPDDEDPRPAMRDGQPNSGPPTSVIPLSAATVRIGRAADNDLVLEDLSVSRYHAKLRAVPGGYEIADLGSHNGTFVNGARVAASPVTELDIIGIGHSSFRLLGGELRQFVDEGTVTVAVHDLTVRVQGGKATGKVLLDGVSFPIPEKCLLGVIGPSGAGKSTLLGALTGMRPADTGAVLYDNRDLYEHYAELRHRIGLVPQENILHTQLTARRALEYSAELRFPSDTTAAERNARVTAVMAELGLAGHADTRADQLSGGQLKRVNVAQELLTSPSLLFLDEPTSGLDPGLDKSVMRQLRDLAHDGRTVIVVTHSVLNLGECDRLLIMAPGGRLAYYGPPGEALEYFGAEDWADVFQGFEADPDRDWAGQFRASPQHALYVSVRHKKRVNQANSVPAAAPPPQRRGWLRQTATLMRRYARVIAADRGYVLFMGLLPLVLGGLIRFVPDAHGLAGPPGTNVFAQELLSIMVICACLAGTACSIRELVKERPIYARERAAGLSTGGYLFSKVVLLGLISVAQSAVIVLLGLAGRRLPAHGVVLRDLPLLELLIAIALLAVASMCLGLLVSALVSTSEKAMPFLVMLTMAQIILAGGVLPLAGITGMSQLAWFAPARWGYAAVASTVNLNALLPPASGNTDPLWAPTAAAWLRDIGLTAALGAAYIAVAWASLGRLGPRRRR